MMLQMCYLQLTVFATYFSLRTLLDLVTASMPPALEAEPFYVNGSQVITFLYPLLAVNQLPRELLL